MQTSSSSGLRLQLSKLLAQHLQQLVASNQSDAIADISFALLLFTATLTHAKAGPSCYDQTLSAHSSVMPFAELVTAISQCNNTAATSALCRGIAQLVIAQELGGIGGKDQSQQENMPSNMSSQSPSLQKLFAHRDVLRALLNLALDKTDSSSAHLCLKLMVQHSDKLKAQLRALFQQLVLEQHKGELEGDGTLQLHALLAY
jgi:hypothetical protein